MGQSRDKARSTCLTRNLQVILHIVHNCEAFLTKCRAYYVWYLRPQVFVGAGNEEILVIMRWWQFWPAGQFLIALMAKTDLVITTSIYKLLMRSTISCRISKISRVWNQLIHSSTLHRPICEQNNFEQHCCGRGVNMWFGSSGANAMAPFSQQIVWAEQ